MDVWWNSERKHLLRSFSGTKQIYLDKKAAFMTLNAVVAYAFHRVYLSLTEKRRRSAIGHAHTLVGIWPAGAVWLTKEIGEQDSDKSMSMQ